MCCCNYKFPLLIYYPQEFKPAHMLLHIIPIVWPACFFVTLPQMALVVFNLPPILCTVHRYQIKTEKMWFFCACQDPTFKLQPDTSARGVSIQSLCVFLFVCFSFVGRPRRSREFNSYFPQFPQFMLILPRPSQPKHGPVWFCSDCHLCLAWGQLGGVCCLTALCTTMGQNSQNTDRWRE